MRSGRRASNIDPMRALSDGLHKRNVDGTYIQYDRKPAPRLVVQEVPPAPLPTIPLMNLTSSAPVAAGGLVADAMRGV